MAKTSSTTNTDSSIRVIGLPNSGSHPFDLQLTNDPTSLSSLTDYPLCFELFLRDHLEEFNWFSERLFDACEGSYDVRLRCELVGREHPTDNPLHAVNQLEDLFLVVYRYTIDGVQKAIPFSGYTQHIISIDRCGALYGSYNRETNDVTYRPIDHCPIASELGDVRGLGGGVTWYNYETHEEIIKM